MFYLCTLQCTNRFAEGSSLFGSIELNICQRCIFDKSTMHILRTQGDAVTLQVPGRITKTCQKQVQVIQVACRITTTCQKQVQVIQVACRITTTCQKQVYVIQVACRITTICQKQVQVIYIACRITTICQNHIQVTLDITLNYNSLSESGTGYCKCHAELQQYVRNRYVTLGILQNFYNLSEPDIGYLGIM